MKLLLLVHIKRTITLQEKDYRRTELHLLRNGKDSIVISQIIRQTSMFIQIKCLQWESSQETYGSVCWTNGLSEAVKTS